MANQGAHRVAAADLRRRLEALQTELAARETAEQELRVELEAARTRQPAPKGWRSWRWGQLPAILTALATVAALFYTARGLSQNQAATTQQNQLAQSGQITDRFNAAVTNLGSEVMTIRLGGIYALQRIMTDSPPDQASAAKVLAAVIRSQPPPAAPTSDSPAHCPIDIQAALTVLTTRNPDHYGINGIDLDTSNLAYANLASAYLVGADLIDANLSNANLVDAELVDANLVRANLSHANLYEAALPHAYLTGADLTGADLRYANVFGADLSNANLVGADLTGTDIAGTTLTNANLAGTTMCNGAKPVDVSRGYQCTQDHQ